MATATLEARYGEVKTDRPTPPEQEQLDQFANRFSRCRESLHFIADLILGGSEMAERAVRNCWIKASQNPPSFESEGPFRSWIMRILISESLSILHQSPTKAFAKTMAPSFARRKTRLRTGER
jgi:DNA-directed RNA polymerase specialized sigma24 family protein